MLNSVDWMSAFLCIALAKENSNEVAQENRTERNLNAQLCGLDVGLPLHSTGADATSKARPTPQTASGTRQICQAPSESGPKTTVPTILLRTATVSTSFASTSKILEREFDNKCIRPNFKILTCKPLSNKVITLLNKGYKYIPQTTHRDKQTLTSTQVASLGFAPDNTELMNSVALLDLLLTHMRKAVLRQIPYNYIQRLTFRLLTCNN